MRQYAELIRKIREEGTYRGDRTGTGTQSIFGHQMRFNLDRFPLVTGKKTFMKSITHELIMFVRGITNIKYLNDNDVHIWDEWADENGDLGPVYGHQWRSWPYNEIMNEGHPEFEGVAKRTIDQLQNVINQIKTNPLSRRLIVSAWNPAEVDDMALPPCHTMFQFYCTEIDYEERYDMARKMMLPCTTDEDMDNERIPKYKLSCQLYQRSADVFLGVPFNIASYAMLTMMIAKISNMVPGDFIWTGGDCHLYANHTKQVDEYLAAPQYELPVMHIKGRQKTIDDFNFEDFVLEDYVCGKHIKAPIAV